MFEDSLLAHKNRLSQLIGINKRYVYLSEILENPQIDDAYKTYFNAEINSRIYEEQIRRRTNPYFDFGSDKIKLQLQELDKIMFQIARFDRASLRSTIVAAVSARLNYLLRPRITLKWFVFRGEPTKAYLEIVKRLSFFKGYDYLISGFIEYVNENNLISSENDLLSSLEFSNIIEKVDNDYLFSLLPEEFIDLILPIAQFFNFNKSNIDKTTDFPIEALIIFLDDKGIDPLKNKLEDLYINKNIKLINGEMFLKQIAELLNEIEQNPEMYQPTASGLNENAKTQNDLNSDLHNLTDTILPPSEFDAILDETGYEKKDIDEAYELNKGYREMMDLANELTAISNALNEMKGQEEKTEKDEKTRTDKEKPDEE